MDNPTEIWRDVSNFEGMYQVSNTGRLRSLDRIAGSKRPRLIKGKIIHKNKSKSGYIYLSLSKNNLYYGTNLHRLVAIAFIPNPGNKPQVNHINGIRDDNKVDNLEWVTLSENHLHAYKNLNRTNPTAIPIIMVDINGKEIRRFNNCSEAGKLLHKHYSTISDHINGVIKLSKEGYTFIKA